MQNIALLEAQISRELSELNHIQGVLADMKEPRPPARGGKENRTPQKRSQTSNGPYKSSSKKTPAKAISRPTVVKSPPEPRQSSVSKPRPSQQPSGRPHTPTKQPQNRPRQTTPLQKKVQDKAVQPTPAKPDLNRLHLSKQVKSSFRKAIDTVGSKPVASSKTPVDSRKQMVKASKLLQAFKQTDRPERESAGDRYQEEVDRLLDQQSQESDDDLYADEINEVLRETAMDEVAERPPAKAAHRRVDTDTKTKTVDQLAREQLEKVSHEFRAARKNSRRFDDRVKLMVLEVGETDSRKRPRKRCDC